MQIDFVSKIKEAVFQTLPVQWKDHSILPQTRLREDLGLDSMTSLTFLMALEEKIPGFIVDPETLETNDLENIATITSYVKKHYQKEIHK